MLEPMAISKVGAVPTVHWYERDFYFNGHNVTKGYTRKLGVACVPRAFQSACSMIGVDVPPPQLVKVANQQRGYTGKTGMITQIFGEHFQKERPDMDMLVLRTFSDKEINLDTAVAMLQVNDLTTGVFSISAPCRHAMALHLDDDKVSIIDNGGFRKYINGWSGGRIHCLLGLRVREGEYVC